MSKDFNTAWLHMHLAKEKQKKSPGMFGQPLTKGVKLEKDLHEMISSECKTRGWIALHGRMDMATGRTIGEPDFTILANHGRTFYVEAKRGKGKVSNEQKALHTWADSLGHKVHVVRSFDEFLTVINQ